MASELLRDCVPSHRGYDQEAQTGFEDTGFAQEREVLVSGTTSPTNPVSRGQACTLTGRSPRSGGRRRRLHDFVQAPHSQVAPTHCHCDRGSSRECDSEQLAVVVNVGLEQNTCLLYTSPSPRDS